MGSVPDLTDATAANFAAVAGAIAADLRALADRVDGLATPPLTRPRAYTGAATDVIHAVTWGVANLGLERLVRRAADADEARAKADAAAQTTGRTDG